jgi:hypothetical protein
MAERARVAGCVIHPGGYPPPSSFVRRAIRIISFIGYRVPQEHYGIVNIPAPKAALTTPVDSALNA